MSSTSGHRRSSSSSGKQAQERHNNSPTGSTGRATRAAGLQLQYMVILLEHPTAVVMRLKRCKDCAASAFEAAAVRRMYPAAKVKIPSSVGDGA